MTAKPNPYDRKHRARRAALLPLAYGQPCPMCGRLMLQGQALELDHSVPVALGTGSVGDRMVHARCNARAGQLIAARRRRRPPIPLITSRSW